MDTVRERAKHCSQNEHYNSSIPLVESNPKIANDIAMDAIEAYCQYAKTGKKPKNYRSRAWYGDDIDTQRPQTLERLFMYAVQAASRDVRVDFEDRVDNFLNAKIMETGVSQNDCNNLRYLIARRCLEKISKPLLEEHEWQFSLLAEPHRRSRTFMKMLFCETSRFYSNVVMSTNEYWIDSKYQHVSGEMELNTCTTAKKRAIDNRKQNSSNLVLDKSLQLILQDDELCRYLFTSAHATASQQALTSIVTWMKERKEFQHELERLIITLHLNNNLEQVIDDIQ